ncbi:MAG TPA: hypothetical protein VGI60_04895 [Chthoniobacterales bacterium]|jgi:hypothetical protein
MNYTFKGRLCGYLCNECFEPLAKIKVRLYRLRPEQNATRLAVAEPKDTFAVLNAEQLRAKEKSLLGEFETDDAGNFTAELGKETKYEGEAFEVDVYCATVPRRLPEPPPKGPVQFTITTVQPQWRERESSLVAAWDYCLPQRFWCYIRSLFDAWVICGRVTVCATGEPAVGVKVLGFDRDWLADDPLGFGVTDANGNFRIDYLGANFRRGTWINVELFGGPDVYFRIESASGDVLLNEPPSQGRTPGRENIGTCFCVDLCVKEAPVVKHAWFTRVGDFALYSDINFATDGLTTHAAPFGFPGAHGGPGYGFFGNLKFVGDCPTTHPSGGDPMRYRFRYESPTSGGLQPVTAANIIAVVVGSRPIMWDVFGAGPILTSQPIYVAPSGATPPGATPPPSPLPPGGTPWGPIPPAVLVPDANGWVTMDPATTNQGFSGPLVRFVSESVVPGGAAPSSGPGVAPASPENGTMLRIVFEAEPVGGPTISSPTLTNELTKLYVNNWSDVNDIGLTEFTGMGNTPCSGLTTDLHIMYTADHELMAAWSLGISTAATPNPVPVLPSGNVPRGAAATLPLNISTWPPCSYTVSLSTRRLLTDGEIEDSGHPNSLTFCKK